MKKVLYDKNLTPIERLTMIYLYSQESKEVEISIDQLCKIINCSNKTMVKAINNLEKANYLKKNKRGQRKNNIYKIN